MQSKSINVNFGHFSAKYQAPFHHFSMCSQNQSIIALIFGHTWLNFITFECAVKINQCQFCHFSPKYQGYSLTFWPNMAHFHHFSMCSQNQSMSILVIFRQNTKVIALLFGQIWLIFITFQCVISHQNTKVIALIFGQIWLSQNQSMSMLVIFRQNTKVIALLFGQKWLIFITFQCAVKINQCQFWSFFGKIPRL